MPVVSQSIDNGNHVVVKILYRSVRSLIDTGSASTMSERLARDLRLPVSSTHRGDYKCLFTANGSQLHIVGKCDVRMNFSGLIIPHSVIIVRDLQENLILGADFLSQNKVIIDYSQKIVSIAGDLVRLPLQSATDGNLTVITTRTVCLQPMSETLCERVCGARRPYRTIGYASV